MIFRKLIKYFADLTRLAFLHLSFIFNFRLTSKNAKNRSSPIVKNNFESKLGGVRTPKIIWIFWNNTPPESVVLSIDLIKKLNPTWTVNVLNSKNLSDFLNVDYSKESVNSPQQLSDLIRLDLLYNYGGVWIDASVLLLKPLDWCLFEMEGNDVDLLGFYRAENSLVSSCPVMENWMIASKPLNPSISAWRNEFSIALKTGVSEYISRVQKNNPECLSRLYDPHYLVCYVAFQMVKDRINSYVLFECDDNAFLYQFSGGVRNIIYNKKSWNKLNLIRNVFLNYAPEVLPDLIKLTSGERAVFQEFMSKDILDGSIYDAIKHLQDNK